MIKDQLSKIKDTHKTSQTKPLSTLQFADTSALDDETLFSLLPIPTPYTTPHYKNYYRASLSQHEESKFNKAFSPFLKGLINEHDNFPYLLDFLVRHFLIDSFNRTETLFIILPFAEYITQIVYLARKICFMEDCPVYYTYSYFAGLMYKNEYFFDFFMDYFEYFGVAGFFVEAVLREFVKMCDFEDILGRVYMIFESLAEVEEYELFNEVFEVLERKCEFTEEFYTLNESVKARNRNDLNDSNENCTNNYKDNKKKQRYSNEYNKKHLSENDCNNLKENDSNKNIFNDSKKECLDENSKIMSNEQGSCNQRICIDNKSILCKETSSSEDSNLHYITHKEEDQYKQRGVLNDFMSGKKTWEESKEVLLQMEDKDDLLDFINKNNNSEIINDLLPLLDASEIIKIRRFIVPDNFYLITSIYGNNKIKALEREFIKTNIKLIYQQIINIIDLDVEYINMFVDNEMLLGSVYDTETSIYNLIRLADYRRLSLRDFFIQKSLINEQTLFYLIERETGHTNKETKMIFNYICEINKEYLYLIFINYIKGILNSYEGSKIPPYTLGQLKAFLLFYIQKRICEYEIQELLVYFAGKIVWIRKLIPEFCKDKEIDIKYARLYVEMNKENTLFFGRILEEKKYDLLKTFFSTCNLEDLFFKIYDLNEANLGVVDFHFPFIAQAMEELIAERNEILCGKIASIVFEFVNVKDNKVLKIEAGNGLQDLRVNTEEDNTSRELKDIFLINNMFVFTKYCLELIDRRSSEIVNIFGRCNALFLSLFRYFDDKYARVIILETLVQRRTCYENIKRIILKDFSAFLDSYYVVFEIIKYSIKRIDEKDLIKMQNYQDKHNENWNTFIKYLILHKYDLQPFINDLGPTRDLEIAKFLLKRYKNLIMPFAASYVTLFYYDEEILSSILDLNVLQIIRNIVEKQKSLNNEDCDLKEAYHFISFAFRNIKAENYKLIVKYVLSNFEYFDKKLNVVSDFLLFMGRHGADTKYAQKALNGFSEEQITNIFIPVLPIDTQYFHPYIRNCFEDARSNIDKIKCIDYYIKQQQETKNNNEIVHNLRNELTSLANDLCEDIQVLWYSQERESCLFSIFDCLEDTEMINSYNRHLLNGIKDGRKYNNFEILKNLYTNVHRYTACIENSITYFILFLDSKDKELNRLVGDLLSSIEKMTGENPYQYF